MALSSQKLSITTSKRRRKNIDDEIEYDKSHITERNREYIRAFWNYRCMDCGCFEWENDHQRALVCHHLFGRESHLAITLCEKCHVRIHSLQYRAFDEYWRKTIGYLEFIGMSNGRYSFDRRTHRDYLERAKLAYPYRKGYYSRLFPPY